MIPLQLLYASAGLSAVVAMMAMVRAYRVGSDPREDGPAVALWAIVALGLTASAIVQASIATAGLHITIASVRDSGRDG